MPISDLLFDKWDALLANWAAWIYGMGGSSEGVSSVYDEDKWRRGSARATECIVLLGDAQDTDKLMVGVRISHPKLYDALDEWARDIGPRHAQASRLGIGPDAYRDRVDSGMRLLEDLSQSRKQAEIKNRRFANQQAIARRSTRYENEE